MFYCFRIRWISSDQDSLFNKTTSSLLGVFVERERERERLQQIRTVSDLDVALDKLAILRAFSFALLSACQD